MDCPKCVGKLKNIVVGKKNTLAVDRCFACGGLWFDKNELMQAINKEFGENVEFTLEAEPSVDQRLLDEVHLDSKEAVCPRCQGNKKMVKIPSPRNPSVLIDFCEKCEGIWLDAGEYDKLRVRSNVELALENVIDFFRHNFPWIFKRKR